MKPAETLELHRVAVRRVIEAHHGRNPRLFGSVARGDDREGSDIDILIEPTPETTLMDIGAMRCELRVLLGLPVDILTPGALSDKFRAQVLAQAVPL
ncbi:MAG: nucleotidyltransferase family protein [Rhodocyclaceae bacterium]|nr:nucleotidyltransferase family protein [Rhodocyclaceae bacterium]